MLYETTLVVEQVNTQHESLGLEDSSEIKYLPIQINVGDIKYHHGYDHETDDGEYVSGTIIRYYDGDMVATLADYNEIAKLRSEFEDNHTIDFEIGGDDESND